MPFKSEAQRRLFWAKVNRGEIKRSVAEEWESATPKGKKLPEHVKQKKAEYTYKLAVNAAFLDELEKSAIKMPFKNPLPAIGRFAARLGETASAAGRAAKTTWSAGRAAAPSAETKVTSEFAKTSPHIKMPEKTIPNFQAPAARTVTNAQPGWSISANEMRQHVQTPESFASALKARGAYIPKGYTPEATSSIRMPHATGQLTGEATIPGVPPPSLLKKPSLKKTPAPVTGVTNLAGATAMPAFKTAYSSLGGALEEARRLTLYQINQGYFQGF